MLDLEKMPKAGEYKEMTDKRRVQIANQIFASVLEKVKHAAYRGKYQVRFPSLTDDGWKDEEMEQEIVKTFKELGFGRKITPDGRYITWRD